VRLNQSLRSHQLAVDFDHQGTPKSSRRARPRDHDVDEQNICPFVDRDCGRGPQLVRPSRIGVILADEAGLELGDGLIVTDVTVEVWISAGRLQKEGETEEGPRKGHSWDAIP
jgi:hypothetical protein